MTRKHQLGFTLMELMITVAIVGLLAAVAYPSYTSSILKGKRAQGRTALVELIQQQERYLTQRNCYLAFSTATTGVATALAPSPTTACGGVTASTVPFKTFSGDSIGKAAYLVTATTCGAGTATISIAECVQAVASPIGPDAEVGSLSLTTTGVKDCTGTAKSSNFSLCWP
jgi:type IV pilus assembly protein PilE